MRVRAVLLLSALSLSGCGYDVLQQQDEQVRTSWSEVVDQYQRRADLVASLATAMKSFIRSDPAPANASERAPVSASAQAPTTASEEVLVNATEARARSGSSSVTMLNDPAAFASYQALQERLLQSVRDLMDASEAYPQLQTDANFRDLEVQLAQTEQRITKARGRYVAAVQKFNTTLRSFPADLTARVFDFRPRPDLAAAGALAAGGAGAVVEPATAVGPVISTASAVHATSGTPAIPAAPAAPTVPAASPATGTPAVSRLPVVSSASVASRQNAAVAR
ncbi:MAG TPA: LemA family protein [Steroidobacteraceae bacterium]|nr:LemA family protein [Steroidobacteraceae bacterium]